jgi:multidrug resistance efflux pump
MALKKLMKVVGLAVAVLLVAALAVVGWLFYSRSAAASTGLAASGTIEAVEVHLGTQLGGKVAAVNVKKGDPVRVGQIVAEVRPLSGAVSQEEIRSPLEAVVLERLFEPGEISTPGSTLLVVGDLYALTLTVYIPEDRYGQIYVGQACTVTVDSFPGRAFEGKVTHIADQAEFTPRNVQTVEGRKSTVFAIELNLSNPDLALKPGMPADVSFSLK